MTQDELREILDGVASGGTLTPEAVVRAAKKPTHALHKAFTWDDKVAGHQYRLEQARVLIRSVTYRARVVHGRSVAVPVYVHNPQLDAGRAGYVELNGVDRASQDAAVVLKDELSRVLGAVRRALAVASRVGQPGLEPALANLLATAESISASIATFPETETG